MPSVTADLVELHDDLATAKNLAAAAFMACHALDFRSNERAALCALTNISREKLEASLAKLDALIAKAKQRLPRARSPRARAGRREAPARPWVAVGDI